MRLACTTLTPSGPLKLREQAFHPMEPRIWNSGSDVPPSADCAHLALTQLEAAYGPPGTGWDRRDGPTMKHFGAP